MTDTKRQQAAGLLATGGGDATTGGVNFQQSLGAVVCAWMLTESPIDRSLKLGTATPIWVRFETEAPIDDVLIFTSENGFVVLQVKTSLSSSRNLDSEYGKTLYQIARQWLACRDGAGKFGWDRPFDATRDRIVIVVGPKTPAPVRQHLASGLEARRQIGHPILNANETNVLADFDACLGKAWLTLTGQQIPADVVTAISRLTFVYPFDPAGSGNLATSITPALLDPMDSLATWQILERVCGDLMSVRGGVDVEGLRRDLLGRGAKLAGRANYRKDIGTLKTYSAQVAASLTSFEAVEAQAGNPISIRRDCQDAVLAAARAGPLLLIGEPGTGKSGVINAMSRDLRAGGSDVIELAVDRFSVESLEGLSAALGLEHGLVEVLTAWDDTTAGYLVIDALDASRSGSGEAVFRTLIEQVLASRGRWTVVASIRTFDLSMGQSLRSFFKGPPPNGDFADRAVQNVVHIHIPQWSDRELDRLKAASPKLAAVLNSGTEKFQELATVPFNTRLVADLIKGGIEGFAGIDSQIALMGLYWEHRVEHHARAGQVCLRAVLDAMVAQRALRAPLLDIAARDPTTLQGLEADGVLVAIDDGRSIQFRHHLIFDFAASRLLLDPSAIISGTARFPRADALGLMLAPAVAFLLRDLWAKEADHERFWIATSRLLGDDNCDPIIRSIASRIATELAATSQDTQKLCDQVASGDQSALAALPHVIGALAVRLGDDVKAPLASWVHLAREIAPRVETASWSLRLLGFLLIDRITDNAQRAALGLAMRALLNYGFTLDESRNFVVPALGFVADTFSTAPGPSRQLLQTVFDPSRFDRFASDEVPALARKIETLTATDPDFAAEIYREVYSRGIDDHRKTSMGFGRILNITSNARQDYDLARYMLSEFFQKFLEHHPVEATRALIDAMEGYVVRAHPIPDYFEVGVIPGPEGEVQLLEDHSHIWAYEATPTYGEDGDVLLARFLAFLKSAPTAVAVEAVRCAIRHGRLAAIWSRLFMAGAERAEDIGFLLWPYARQEPFIIAPDTRKDAIDLIAASYLGRSEEERRAFEEAAPKFNFTMYKNPEDAKQELLRRLFSAIGADRLVTTKARIYVDAAKPSSDINRRLFNLEVSASEVPAFPWLNEAERSDPNNARLTSAVDVAKESLHLEQGNATKLTSLDEATASLRMLKRAIDSAGGADETLRNHGDGILSQGCGKVIAEKLVNADSDPELVQELVGLIEFCCSSPGPLVDGTTDERFERFASWGSPASRVDAAASCLNLCLQRPDLYTGFEPLIDALITDIHPAVRLQATHHLIRIWDIDRHGFWRRARLVIEREQNRAVLDHFVTGVLGRLTGVATNEIAELVLPLLDRFPSAEDGNRTIHEHLTQLVAMLWIMHEQPAAEAIAFSWRANPIANVEEVCTALRMLGSAVTAGLRGEADTGTARARAQAFFAAVVSTASDKLGEYAKLKLADLTYQQRDEVTRCGRIIDSACQQLFFASGVFRNANSNDAPALTPDQLHSFFLEVAPTLRRIGDQGSPHTIYYLIQLLERLVESDPAAVFDLLANALLSGGKETGYQYESLGSDLFVRLIGLFLADHKKIFDVPARRQALIDCLETFLTAGWPAARRLLYRLPELIQ